MKLLGKVEIHLIELTPEMAREFLENMKGQRTPHRVHVEQYARDMKSGAWVPNISSPFCFGSDGRLLNGQHRCLAVIKAGVTIQVYAAYDVSPELFSVMDIGCNRSAADVLNIAGLTDKYYTLTAAIVRYLVILEKFGTVTKTVRVTPAQSLAFMQANKAEVDQAVLAAAQVRSISAPLGAVYFHFARLNREKADRFIKALRLELFGDENHPGAVLLKKLRRTPKGVRVDREQIVTWTFAAFTAYFENRKVKSIRSGVGAFDMSDSAVESAIVPYPYDVPAIAPAPLPAYEM